MKAFKSESLHFTNFMGDDFNNVNLIDDLWLESKSLGILKA